MGSPSKRAERGVQYVNNMLGYMTVCYKPNLHGCVTSKKAESAPVDPVGGLAAWQNSASCDGCRTTLLFLFVLPELCVFRGCGCLWKILKRQIEQEPAGNQLGKRYGNRPPPHEGFPQVLRPRHELKQLRDRKSVV